MQSQPEYADDTFGLRTLDESGRLNLTVVPGATHGDWTGNIDVRIFLSAPRKTRRKVFSSRLLLLLQHVTVRSTVDLLVGTT